MACSKKVIDTIKEGYLEDYKSYRDSVLSGARIASRDEMLKVQRQERDLNEGVDGYHWDWDAALRPLVWMAVNLRFPLGPKRGSRFILAPWQVYDTMLIFGWIDETGQRRFLEGYIEVPRKNGKSTWMGGLIDYCAFGEIKGVSCFIAATSLDQAEETFRRAAEEMQLAKHKNFKVANSKNNKIIEFNQSQIKAIAAAPKDGKLAYLTIIDEYHQHKTNELVDSISSGNVSDQQALLLRITTAGTSLTGPCHEEFVKCEKILSGEAQDDRYFISIYHADEGDNPGSEDTWYKANPNLGRSVDEEKFRAKYNRARLSAADMVTFKTKNLNMWVRGTTRWAKMPIWEEKCKWKVDPSSLRGEKCYCGLDLSSVYDFTSFTADIITDRGHVLLQHYWISEGQVDAIARVCGIPLRQWVSDGLVTATPGDVVDYDYVRDYLNDFREQYDVQYIAVDRWAIDELEVRMPAWFSDCVYEFSQGLKSMCQATKKFERAYLSGEVSALGNPIMDWMMDCCEAKIDSSDNYKLVKADKHTKRIDGVITSIMAYDCADVHGAEDKTSLQPGSLMFW